MLVEQIRLQNFLSYGPDAEAIELQPLNIFIGPNASGKSNLLDAFHLLRSTVGDLWGAVRAGGSTIDWVWRGANASQSATIEAVVRLEKRPKPLRYGLTFTQLGGRFEIVDERVEMAEAVKGKGDPYFFYRFQNGRPVLNTKTGSQRTLKREDIDPQKSILVQRRDPDLFPELAAVGDRLAAIRSYRGWPITPDSALRRFQRTDAPNEYLLEDGSNLALVLNRLSRDTASWRLLRNMLRDVYEGIEDIAFEVESNSIRVMVREKWFVTPSTRLSDGTLRFLCLLAVLLDSRPSPLICLDEPEIGLHPDVVHKVADLLKEASLRTQLIVTTHSRELLDAVSDRPECVVVCERVEGQTHARRLAGPKLLEWAREYGVGKAWREGEIGGNRW